MEELLNKLIEKGWKPFGRKSDNIWIYCLSDKKIVISYYDFDTEGECNHEDKWCDFRQLTSKESGLWQFVCENGMLETKGNVRVKNYWGDDECDDNCCDDDLEYWLMESALCNEDELEDFLLQNIKVDGE